MNNPTELKRAGNSRASAIIAMLCNACQRIPDSAIALLARFSIAAIFWQSGQTKVEGLVIDLLAGRIELGWPPCCR